FERPAMHRSLVETLREPGTGRPLRLEASGSAEIVGDGALVGERRYPIIRGIPRFVDVEDEGQRQTQGSFAFKWGQRSTYDSDRMRQQSRRWLLERYGFASVDEMQGRFRAAHRVLDAGCGSG